MKDTAVLLINCPDRKGIVAGVANFLYQHSANILHADEHQDSELNLFFLRVEWDISDFDLDRETFSSLFGKLAGEFKMTWEISYSKDITRVALFVSKEDHCLADLLYRYKSGELSCKISFIISNHDKAKSLADFYKIPYHYIPYIQKKETVERHVINLLKKDNTNLVVLARYMQILSKNFIEEFDKPIINIHHSFLPSFAGAKPYHQAFSRGVKIIGATSHYVTQDLDQGPIIEQDVLKISHRDSIEDLIIKGKDIEKLFYLEPYDGI